MHHHNPEPHEVTEQRYPVDEDTVREQAAWMAGEGGSFVSRTGRKLSERTSRRSMLSRIGRWTMGVSGVALISSLPPVTRTAMAQETPQAPPAPEAPEPPSSSRSTARTRPSASTGAGATWTALRVRPATAAA